MKLHVGCGTHLLPNWINLDLGPGPGVTVYDATMPLPYASGSIEFVYSEHFLEHLPHEAALAHLADCFRVLKPGGSIRVSCPDLMALVRAYLNKDTEHYKKVAWLPKTPCQMMNEGMRLWEHQFLYDQQELTQSFHRAGFTAITAAPYRVSRWPALCALESRPDLGDLILEGTKP